jgi:hypothetical protein
LHWMLWRVGQNSRPQFTCGKVNIGQEDKSELGAANVNAIGLLLPSFGSKEFHVGAYLFVEIEGEMDDDEKV